MKKWIGYLALALSFCALGFAYQYAIPRAEKWLLQKLNSTAQLHSPFDVKARSIKLNPLILGLEVNDLIITPKEEFKKSIDRISVTQVFTRLSFLGLLKGQIRLAQVSLDKVTTQVFIDTSSAKKQNEITIPFDQIFRAPIDLLEIKNATVLGKIEPQKTVFKAENLKMRAEIRYRSLWIDVEAPSVLLKPSGPTRPIQFELEVRGLVERDQIRLTALKAKREDSYLISSGLFWGDISHLKVRSSEMASKLHLDVSSLQDWQAILAPDKTLPHLQGTVDLSVESGFNQNQKQHVRFKTQSQGLKVNQFEVGQLNLTGSYSDDMMTHIEGEIKNSGGAVQLRQVQVSLTENFPIQGSVQTKVELGAFMNSIGIKKAPFYGQLQGHTNCKGQLKNEIQIQCQETEVQLQKLHIFTDDKPSKTILKLQKAQASGAFEVNQKEVQFASQVLLGENSRGTAKGNVHYEDGFAIFFKGEEFHFSDIENLSDLKLEGHGKIEGETRGNSKTANFSLIATLQDFVLDDYKLGQITSKVKYDRGYLHFRDTSGLYGSSRYSGHVSLNLPDSQAYIYIKSPYLELNDVKGILERRLPIPVAVSGTGQAEFKASGPLDIKKMNYETKISLFRGALAGETFDSFSADLRAVDGTLKTEKARLVKGTGDVTFSGTVTPAWTIDLSAVGQGLRLEQSEKLNSLGLDIQGTYSFKTRIVGDIQRPTIEIQGQTNKMVTGSVPVEDSNFSFKILQNQMSGSAELLGNQLVAQFNLPFDEQAPFELKMKAKDFNVSSIFEAISQARQTYDFQTTLSLDADLSSPSGGFWKSTGLVSINKFMIRRGSQSLSSSQPMRLIFNQGVINSENFELAGEGHSLRFDLSSSTKDKIDGRLNGKVDLNIFGPFMAFASEIRGVLSLNTSLKGNIHDVNMSGSAYLDKGYLKAKEFPHPFTELKADMLFNQKTLFFNSLQGEVAGGKISGDGKMRFENSNSIPIQISGFIKDTSLNFPEGYRTKGSAQISLSGQNTPYRFKVVYDVSQAEINSEFGGGGKASEVKRSPYLPPSIAKASEEPFFLDLTLNFLNPIAISNSMVNAAFRGQLAIEGTPQQLTMRGALSPLPGGLIYFRDVPFEVSNGNIEYDSVAPDNPKLYLSASAQVAETVYDEDRRQTQRQYEVSMLVQGRAQDPQVTLNSQPPLPQKDIVSLLALGMTPEALDESRTTGQQVTSTSTTALGAALLQKPVGRQLKDRFGVDMKVTSSQSSTDVASSARVTLSKQWTPQLSIAASGTIEANPRSSVRLEYQVSKSLSVIGSWEGQEQGAIEGNQSKDVTNSILGLDLEYRMQFK